MNESPRSASLGRCAALGPHVAWLRRLQERMDRRRWWTDDPLYQQVLTARRPLTLAAVATRVVVRDRGMGTSMPRRAAGWLSILCVAFAAGGCGFQKLRDVYTDGVQASSVQTRVLASHAYQTVWLRPTDMAHPRGTNGEQFTLSLPDGRVVALTELTPAMCDAVARSVVGCSTVMAEAGSDNAASAWNDFRPRAARLPLHKPPRIVYRPVSPEARPATDFVMYTLRYEVKRRYRPGLWYWGVIEEAVPLCEYRFWFDRERCVQVRVSVSDRPLGLAGFVPAVGARGPHGVRSQALPIREEHLTDLYGPVRARSIFE